MPPWMRRSMPSEMLRRTRWRASSHLTMAEPAKADTAAIAGPKGAVALADGRLAVARPARRREHERLSRARDDEHRRRHLRQQERRGAADVDHRHAVTSSER